MRVLSHRGYWKQAAEKNSVAAFCRSFDCGFGTETDVRDRLGELVISHDPPRGGELLFHDFLDLLGDRDLPLAINVKADGLAERIRDAFRGRPLTQWFVFDMSFPDSLQQLKWGNPVYQRTSEFEPLAAGLQPITGVWLDSFESDWWTAEDLETVLARDQAVCIVSPELHQRDPIALWNRLAALRTRVGSERVSLCTDRPQEACLILGVQP